MKQRWGLPQGLRSPDLALAAAVAAVVAALAVPLPAWAIDTGLALNLAGSVGLLVAALLAHDALAVTAFPTLLLITTLFRLSLNVASTRLALAEGHAGEVIQAFGEFVVRGDYFVGAALFLILAVVQFLVVAKGAERVAEVSARFTLDAMPGKQMSIDADLRAGIVDAPSAQRRRRVLERESQMFGAMDGAMKFVKGDVIASSIIVMVNLCAGTAIGVIQHSMTLSEAAATYALIAVGDGLVSQLSSLCVALAAGLLVTRVSGEDGKGSLGSDIARQFLGEPRVLFVVAGLCLIIGTLPGIPHLTFGLLALVLVGLGVRLRMISGRSAGDAQEGPPKRVAASFGVAPLCLDLGVELSNLVENRARDWVSQTLEGVREELYLELGVRPPGIRVRTRAPNLNPRSYRLLLEEVPLAQAEVVPDAAYARATTADIAYLGVGGEAEREPGTGAPLTRLAPGHRETVQAAGVEVLSALELVSRHVARLLRGHAAQLLGLQEVRALVDELEAQAPTLVQETLQKVPLPLLTEVLRQLLLEEVSIRNLKAVFEALASPSTEGDAAALVERCRQGLSRYLSHKYAPDGPLYAYLADPAVEEALRGRGGPSLALDPERVEAILAAMRDISAAGGAVVLTAADTRRTLRKLCEGTVPNVAVLTYRELEPHLRIRPLGRLLAASSPRPALALGA